MTFVSPLTFLANKIPHQNFPLEVSPNRIKSINMFPQSLLLQKPNSRSSPFSHSHDRTVDQKKKMMMIKKQLTGVTTTVIRPRPLIPTLLLVSIFFFILFLLSRLVFVGSSFSLSFSVSYSSSLPNKNSPDLDKGELTINRYNSSSENTIRCDRKSSSKYDICYMKGDIRTVPSSSSIILYSSRSSSSSRPIVERIRPYPRKWESVIMDTVDELTLQVATTASAGDSGHNSHACDVYHSVPAVVFYTGGYTGNLFHEFNDGILPLYITAQHFNKQVVFVILKYHSWWISKYNDILFQLSDHPPIDFYNDSRTHCFPEMTVGLRAHDELSIDPTQSTNNKTIFDFRRLLETAYRYRLRSPVDPQVISNPRPKITIVSRTGARGIENEGDLLFLCEKVGFRVKIIKPSPTTDLAEMYKVLNDTDVMVGVHGAALTHFLFLRPGSAFIQIVPLGNGWVAELCFGKAARRMGMEYVEYKIKAEESSLYRDYGKDDPVLRQPEKLAAERGWKVIKKVYLDGQSVKLDLDRFGKLLVQTYNNHLRKF